MTNLVVEYNYSGLRGVKDCVDACIQRETAALPVKVGSERGQMLSLCVNLRWKVEEASSGTR